MTTGLVRLARALHRLLLRLAPGRVRRAHAGDMRETFDAMIDAAATRGSIAIVRVIGLEMVDMLRARGLQEKMTDHTTVRRPRSGFATELISLRGWLQSMRSLARRPAFAIVAVIALGFGAGITTVVFSLVDTILLSPLPYPQPDRLVTLYEASPSDSAEGHGKTSLIAPGRLEDWQRLNTTFVAVSGTYGENVTETSGPDPERLDGRRVTPRFFTVYGAAPLVGRTFTNDEERTGGPAAVVIGEGFWARRFARDPNVVGRRLLIGGSSYSIVGVMPVTFASAATDVWLSAQVSDGLLAQRDARFVNGVGRMKPGVTIAQAHDDLARVQRSLGEQFPKTDKNWSVEITDLKTWRITGHEQRLWLVFGAVGLLWLIGVANLAGLMLVQMRRRGPEMAVRAAIGASRSHIVGNVLREVLTLAAAGSLIGTALAAWLISVARATFPTLPRTTEIGFNTRALIFALVSSALAATLCSVWPALQATRGALAAEVARGGRGSSNARHRFQQTLVAVQVALSVLLVASALLLTRSYLKLSGTDAGFNADGVLTFHVGARWDEDRTRIGQLQVQLLDGLSRLPGVAAAGFSNFLPMTGASLRSQIKVGGLAGTEQDGSYTVGTRMISPDYLRAMSISITSGTTCPPLTTDPNGPRSALVNRRFVEAHASGQNLVGRELSFAQFQATFTIVGIVGDVIEDTPGAAIVPYAYTCQAAGAWPDPEYVVRTHNPQALAGSLRQLVHTLDPDRAVFAAQPLDARIVRTMDEPRLSATMLGLFAGSALALASLGLYSLFMLVIAERAREIGVRLALGAAPADVRRHVVVGAGRLCLAGIGVGLILSAVTQRLLGSLLFGITPLDPVTFGVTIVTLMLAAALAIALPAIRAGRIDPIVAMRDGS